VSGVSAREDRLALLSLLADGTHPLELRWFTPGGARKAFYVDPRDADGFAECLTLEFEVFVGVLPRLGEYGGCQRQYAPGSVLWADCDSERSVVRLETFEPSPTCVVLSGGLEVFAARRHAYWLLDERVPADEITRYVRRLAAHLEADLASTDAARVLRLPGSVNRKTGIVARVERLTDDSYQLSEVVGDLPDAPEPAHRGTPEGNATARTVPGGERHAALVSLLGCMRRWGAAEPVLVAAAVSFCERQCATDPAVPLDIGHAERTARHVAKRYPAGPACTWGMRR
jgi:hypothetical protein